MATRRAAYTSLLAVAERERGWLSLVSQRDRPWQGKTVGSIGTRRSVGAPQEALRLFRCHAKLLPRRSIHDTPILDRRSISTESPNSCER
jgi:hypothetical protein